MSSSEVSTTTGQDVVSPAPQSPVYAQPPGQFTQPAGPPTWGGPPPWMYQQPPQGFGQFPGGPGASFEDDEEDDSRGGCLPIILGALLLMFFLVVFAGVTAFGVFYFLNQGGSDTTPDGNATIEQLAEDIEDVMAGVDGYQKHARYISMTCRGIAGRLEEDYRDGSDWYDEPKEVLSLVSRTGDFMLVVKDSNGQELNKYRGLDRIVEGELRNVFQDRDIDEEGTISGGELSSDEQDAVVEMFNRLGDAFMEVAN